VFFGETERGEQKATIKYKPQPPHTQNPRPKPRPPRRGPQRGGQKKGGKPKGLGLSNRGEERERGGGAFIKKGGPIKAQDPRGRGRGRTPQHTRGEGEQKSDSPQEGNQKKETQETQNSGRTFYDNGEGDRTKVERDDWETKRLRKKSG